MKLNSEDLRELYQRETSRSAHRSTTDCLTEDTLARAATGDLDQSERERTADHMVTCSDCAREYRAIKSLKSWAYTAATDLGDGRMRPAISENGHHPDVVSANVGSRRVSFYLPYAVAAAAIVLSFILGGLLLSKSRENQRLIAEVNEKQSGINSADAKKNADALAESQRSLEEATRRAEQEATARRAAEEQLARREAAKPADRDGNRDTVAAQRISPDINVPIIDLNPRDIARGDQNQQPAKIQLNPDTDLFTLVLNLSAEDSSSSYSLEVVDRNSKIVWTGQNLRKSAYNNFTVALHRRSFPPGDYRMKIFGLRDGRRQLVEEYSIRLSH